MPLRQRARDVTTAATAVAFGERNISELGFLGERLCWVERAPSDGNQPRLVTLDGPPVDPAVRPEGELYGYGGGGWTAYGDDLAYVAAGAVHLARAGQSPRVLVPATPDGWQTFGDLQPGPAGTVIAVRERGADARRAAHAVVAIAVDDGAISVLAEGEDFYLSPRLSPDQRWLAYLSWADPNLPWIGGYAVLLPLAPDGTTAGPAQRVELPEPGAVRELHWLSDGRLLLVAEDAECTLWVVTPGADARPLWRTAVELSAVPWAMGLRTVAEIDDGSLAVLGVARGRGELWLVRRDGTARAVPLPFSAYPRPSLRARGRFAYVVAASERMFPALVEIDIAGGGWRVLRSTFDAPPGPLPLVRTLTTVTPDGTSLDTVVTVPADAPASTPVPAPAVVFDCHGGPTDQAFPMLTPLAWFLTTLGLVVAQVNYRGSSGYGRAFRDTLAGRWGELDVADVRAVLAAGDGRWWDTDRVFLRGESAGGLTILGVAAGSPVAGLVSLHGAVDGASLRETTHKFEAGYVDWLLGQADAGRGSGVDPAAVSCPALIVAGSDDSVVPVAQAYRLVEALRRAGQPARLLEFPAEGHGLIRPEAIARALTAEGEFYLSAASA